MVGCSSLSGSDRPMPHKHNADRRHHIPKVSFKVRNWSACEAALRRRGSLTSLMGLTISAPDHATVSRRAVTLPVIQAPAVPHGPLHVLIDSTGLPVYGAGQWLEAKHGAKSRRTWRKLHLAVDAANGMVVAQTLTDQDADDPSQVGPLLDQINEPD